MKDLKNVSAAGDGGRPVRKNDTTHFLVGSFVLIFAVCIGILVMFSKLTDDKGEETINEIGSIYMTGMNERISMHFDATIDSRLTRVEYLISSVPPGDAEDYETMKRELTYGARISNLSILGLYGEDGAFERIYGEEVTLADEAPFFDSLKKGEKKIAMGTTGQGEAVILFGVPAKYPMRDGGKSLALAAAVPVDYIKQFLALDNDYSLVYSHIIRRDGSFVIQSRPSEIQNFFDQIRLFSREEGDQDGEDYVQGLKHSMENKTEYSALFYADNDRRHLYCTPLPYSEWYLVTVMPYGSLDTTVGELTGQRFVLLLVSIGIILSVLLVIFFMYYRRTRKQIQAVEDACLEAEKASRAKSEFLSNMSHDIRTPMNAILGMTAIASAHMDNPAQVQDCLKKITLSGRHLLGLINDVLDMSKIESGKMTLSMERVSLPEILEGIVNIVQPQVKEKQQRFEVFIHDISAEEVYCDSVRLNQVLLNLLSNAVKFTPRGGFVSVSLYEEASPRGENYVRMHLKVRDTGIGMSSQFIEKIFDSFSREDDKRVNKTEGTGLGMAITKYIVDAMEGSIEVESEPGRGTEFHVTLELEKAELQEEMILPDWKMLLVDDDEELCRSALASLRSIGIQSDRALDGRTAISMVEERHRKRDDYQIILLDWQLPDIDGIETARRIRQRMGEEVPILLISAYDWSEIEEEAKQAGVTGFISKPLFRSTLFYGIKRYTGESAQIPEQSPNYRTDFQGARILVAEDNDLNWEIAFELLSQLGLELEWAENGQICLERFAQAPVGYYAAILMDIRMPVMTGYEAAKAIRALDREDSRIPIIAMTADAFYEDVQRCLESGMNAHIAKPIDVKEVARLLERYIG